MKLKQQKVQWTSIMFDDRIVLQIIESAIHSDRQKAKQASRFLIFRICLLHNLLLLSNLLTVESS